MAKAEARVAAQLGMTDSAGAEWGWLTMGFASQASLVA